MQTALQLNLALANHPGSLAHMSDALRAADVNIEALFQEEGPKESIVHLIVDDPETAKIVLRREHQVTETAVLAIRANNKPGVIANLARCCAGANINIRHIYATTAGKLSTVYLSVDDLERAKAVLK